ncbi:MAG: tetratricopeptide repeat protein [Verrucomicrobiota bacterium]
MIARILLLLGFFSATALAQSEVPATAYLKNGRNFQGIVVSVNRTKIDFRLEQSAAGLVSFKHDEIRHVEFSPNTEWAEAMQAFAQRNYEQAALKLEAIAKKRNSSTFYPAIGNFSSLADRRLLDCYRRMMKPEGMPAVVNRIEWDKLPPAERDAYTVASVWSAVGQKDWPGAIQAADEALRDVPPGSSDANEASYLKGLALDENGDEEKAVVAFGAVIGPYPGANRRTASEAIRRSAAILAKNPERSGELQALVHIYAKSFGNGKLWPEATPEMKKLLAEELKPAF